MFARIAGAKVRNSCDQRCWAVFKMEDEGRRGGKLVAVATKRFFRNAWWYFRLRKQQRAGNFKRAWALNGIRNGLPAKLFEPCTERWRILKNSVHCCWHHFLRRNCQSKGLVYKEFVAHYRLENHLRRVSTIRWSENKRVYRESGRICLCLEDDQHHNKNPPSVRLDLLLPRIIRLHYSAFHNFKKLEPFINAGLGLVFQRMSKIYFWIVLERNGVQMFWFFFLANSC